MKSKAWIGAFLVAAIPLAWLVARFNFLCDDAFISFRFARHLALGNGLRFNLGVEPPVEGYTNLLWILWCALFERFELDSGVFSRLTSIALAFGLLALVVRLVHRRFSATNGESLRLAPIVAGLFLGLHPSFGTWATSGMETMAFAFCLFLGFERLLIDRDRPRTGQAAVALIAAALLRADGAVACTGVLAGIWLLGSRERSTLMTRSAVRVFALLVLAVSAQVVFRYLYHGDLVPNTAHAKVSFGSATSWRRGAIYVAHFAVLFPAVAAAPLLAFFRPSSASPTGRTLALTAFVPFATIYLWSLAVGGDYMAFGRFLVPAIPFAAVLFAFGIAGVRRSGAGTARLTVCALLLCTQLLPAFSLSAAPTPLLEALNFRLHKRYESQTDAWEGLVTGVERGTFIGKHLARLTEPGDSMVAGAVGAQAYYSDLFIHDRLGLVTREVAMRDAAPTKRAAGHDKGVSAAFFRALQPTIMHLVITKTGRRGSMTVPPDLAADYVVREVPVGGKSLLQMLVHKDSHFAKE